MIDAPRRILIVGGVAGGASCAARARRLCERCEIVIFDRGPFVSFANCGLPYFVGDVIKEEADLLVATPDLFTERFNIQVRTRTEVLRIDRERRTLAVRDLETGHESSESYDALVLSPGARPIRPPLPGIDLPGIFVLRTIPDSRKIRTAVTNAGTALVVGGGFIGLEMAENLTRRGLAVTILELAPQVMPPLDPEMAAYVEQHLRTNGVGVVLGSGASSFEQRSEGGLRITTTTGDTLDTDVVILAIGVRPESTLAKEAGITLGELGGIRVDDRLRTSDPHIWAVGDAVEVRDAVTGRWAVIPLAGPANRQGRIAARSIIDDLGGDACGGDAGTTFRGVQGTAGCGVFGLTVAATGASEKTLTRLGETEFERVYLHPGNHADYYPGAQPIHLKLLFAPGDGRLLGAQAVGKADVARRIDVISMALQKGGTVYDLEEAELCYAPQYGAAKDPVNIAGMIAANHLRGCLPLADWHALLTTDAHLIDVRSPTEFEAGSIPGATNIPLEELRGRLAELPAEREIWLLCGVGQRAYYATRTLLQRGHRVRVLSGGMATYRAWQAAALPSPGARWHVTPIGGVAVRRAIGAPRVTRCATRQPEWRAMRWSRAGRHRPRSWRGRQPHPGCRPLPSRRRQGPPRAASAAPRRRSRRRGRIPSTSSRTPHRHRRSPRTRARSRRG
jgi:NADPH-dependent 2,4-dienoyl-CoA reductase/sulfur reductase-like enzyme/rhodanese-related sulfurtransferase